MHITSCIIELICLTAVRAHTREVAQRRQGLLCALTSLYPSGSHLPQQLLQTIWPLAHQHKGTCRVLVCFTIIWTQSWRSVQFCQFASSINKYHKDLYLVKIYNMFKVILFILVCIMHWSLFKVDSGVELHHLFY